ncbi:Bacterial extracellular solute-binding protein [Paenibacillus konkukensis]|uniref:Bacterial extracellular solute-binding protein n=1 Tax=Paenibacillus konkukensis TaxID=2020716 RepID=A0ABY4RMM5_9BACL|nr:extracellular solute-binding protein [Paenibacillus konkukensis]UQZ82552.1 Bacterial extracellular solute-binding protein [Paenibacillus konkukensis]
MKYQKTAAAVVAASMLLSMLTACGGGGGEAASSDQAIKTSDDKETADLVVYSNSGDSPDSWNERFGNALQQKFPGYNIKYIQKQSNYWIKELLTAGETIDIYWDSIGGFASGLLDNGLEFDMTDLAKKYQLDLSKMEPSVADSVKLIAPDKMYGIPVFNNNMVLYYNKDLFDKFGVPYPKDGMTWTEANQLAQQLTRVDGKPYIGLSSSQTHMLAMNQLSIPFVDPATEKPTIFTDEKWREFFDTVFVGPSKSPGYVDYMKELKDTIPYRNEFLKEKNLAMFAWLSSIIFVFPDEYKSMNWDMVSLPTFDSLPKVGSQAYPTYFAVTSMSKQKDQAMKVIQYLTTEEMQTKLSKIGLMPVLNSENVKKVYGQESAFKDKNLAASFYNGFAPIPAKSRYDSLLLTPYAKAVPKIIMSGDYNTVFRATEEDTAKKIADAKK